MNLYQKICNKIILPITDNIIGWNTYRRLKEIDKFQWMDHETIETYQLQRLRNLLHLVSNHVPFYQKFFNDMNLNVNDFGSIEDLKLLPVVTKSTINEYFEELRISNYPKKIYEMKSSGSTGQQTTVLIDNAVNTEIYSTQLLFWSWGGFHFGVPHLQTGMSLERGALKRLKDIIFLCSYESAFELTDSAVHKIVKKIKHRRLKYLFGYASSIYVIARYMEDHNINLFLRKIFTWGDSLFPHYRTLIENVFSCKVMDCYGLGEGLQVACQCDRHDSLHIAEHHVIVEITDSTGHNSCGYNAIGKVLVTRLEPGPMPLLRYDTGDLASFVQGKCSCGRNLKMLSRIKGRDTDIIRSPAGDRLIVHYFTQIFEMIPEIAQFQARQTRLEEIDILYVPRYGFEETLLEKIRKQIHENCKYKLKINFKKVVDIPLEKSNKRRFVISSLPFEI